MCKQILIVTLSFFLMLSVSAQASTQLQDPTEPPQAKPLGNKGVAKNSGKPVLSSILIGKNRRFAILDDRLVGEGALTRGLRVERILQDRVELSNLEPEQGSGKFVVWLDSARVVKERR